jgi:hypothetical protein
MAKKVYIPFIYLLLVPCFLPLPFCGLLFFLPAQATPLWWDIKVVLYADGEYKLEQKKISYSGDYSFKIVWTGSIEREKDDQDYILYHQDCYFSHWKAKEKKISPESVQTKVEKDFKTKPTFHLNYILRKEERLHFDFMVEGFPIPQNESDDKIYLHMPCYSESSKLNPLMEYDSFIIEGSNQISLGEKEIYDAPLKREFCWAWKLQKWTIGFSYPTRLTNLHKAKLKISIIPHFE